jgi:hypothetical protein
MRVTATSLFTAALVAAAAFAALAVAMWPREAVLPRTGAVAKVAPDLVAPIHAGTGSSVPIVSTDPALAAKRVTPVSIAAPGVGIKMTVKPMGLTPSRAMALPETAEVAAWYRHGAVPGDGSGAALIAAHVSDDSGFGPFANLANATPGMTVTIQLSDGTRAEYVIVDVAQLSKQRLDIPAILDDARGMLVLITCGGRWDANAEHYEDNVLAWAVPSEISWSAQ